MDADVKQAFDEIKLQIQSLYNAVLGIKGGSGAGDTGTAHAPPAVFHGFNSADADWSQWTDLVGNDRFFNKDFWFLGLPGAQKGVNLSLWGAANTMLGMMGTNSKTIHFKIVTLMDPQPNGGHWLDAIKSPADIGWIDGSRFAVDPTASNGAAEAAWEAAGCPSVDAEGYLISMGRYVTDQKGNKLTKAMADAEFKVG